MHEAESIGSAHMEADGTVVLRLRAEGAAGMVGEGVLMYRPTDHDYANVLGHLGGLRPGEEKPVPPFPEAWGTAS